MEHALAMGLLLERKTDTNGGRPSQIGTLVWDADHKRNGILLGYTDADVRKGEKILMPLPLLSKFLKNLDHDYSLKVEVVKKGRTFTQFIKRIFDFD
jgi:hypothetical protein